MSDRPSGAAPSRLVAVLGPPNTGKTPLAVERMLGHASGMIGPPLPRGLRPGGKTQPRRPFRPLRPPGPGKLPRLPRRPAVVAFSADAVYAIAELIRRQRGGAAVVMGSLSPRTRNAQVALYQSG